MRAAVIGIGSNSVRMLVAEAADGEIRPGCGCRLDSHFKIRECMRITYGKIKKNRSADNRDSRITDWKSDSLFCQVSHDA